LYGLKKLYYSCLKKGRGNAVNTVFVQNGKQGKWATCVCYDKY